MHTDSQVLTCLPHAGASAPHPGAPWRLPVPGDGPQSPEDHRRQLLPALEEEVLDFSPGAWVRFGVGVELGPGWGEPFQPVSKRFF